MGVVPVLLCLVPCCMVGEGVISSVGKWGIWNLSLFLDGAEFKARQSEVFMNISDTDNNMCETSTFIMLKMILNYINPKVYQFDYLDPINLTVTKQLCELGTSTHSTVTKLIHSDTGELLVERLAKLCRVDNETHRPVKWSPQFHQMFSHLKDRGMPKVLKKTSTPIPTSPPDCFKWTFKSRYSDMDVKMHANQSMYIKSCIDCATEASMNGQLDQFNGDIIWYPFSLSSDETVWENLIGIPKVISKPAIRFLKDGIGDSNDDDDYECDGIVVPVVQVKSTYDLTHAPSWRKRRK
ncbi:unnamed protein product [Mytilus edulis]|uniref:Uncharacterized protein n=1 Tax=Mytilus edulis TaxID=6550 RepID=A0A8S3SST0_MYTED|nr:unnamed protein product [Mytilus edulis]